MTGGSYAIERAEKGCVGAAPWRILCSRVRGEGAFFPRGAGKRGPKACRWGRHHRDFFKTVRAGGHRACDEKQREEAQKGAKTFAKPSPGGQKSSQKGAKTFAKPPPGGPGRVLGPLGAPIEKKDHKKTGVTPKVESYFGGVFGTFLKK